MRRPLNKRLKRDLITNLGRYFSIAALLIATIAMVSAFLVVADSIEHSYKQNQIDALLEDGMFRLYDPISDETVEEIEALKASVYENYYVDMDVRENTTLRIYQYGKQIDVASIIEGKLPEDKNEIAIDRLYATNNELSIGDDIVINNQDIRITGFVSLPNYSSLFQNNSDLMMDSFHFGVAIVTQEAFDSFPENTLTYNYGYRLDDKGLSEKEKRDYADKIKSCLIDNKATLTYFSMAKDNQSISFVGDDMGSDVPMIKVLLFIILVIMAFVFSIVIRSTIEEESTIIGTLLASGYSKYELIWHYMSLPVLVTFISAVVGNILGYTVMINPFKEMYYSTYSLPLCIIEINVEAFILTTVLPVSIMIIVNFLTLRKNLSISPLMFLRKDIKKKGNKKAIKLPHFSFVNRFRMRIMIQNKTSYMMLFVGVFLASFLLLFGLGLKPLFTHYLESIEDTAASDYQYLLKEPFQIKEASGGEKFTAYSLNTFLKVGKKDIEVTFYGIEENSVFFPGLSVSHEQDNIYFSDGLLKKIGAEVGDTITFTDEYTDIEYKVKVTGTYDYPIGMSVFMNHEQLNQMINRDVDYFNGYFSNEKLEIEDSYLATVITPEDMTRLGEQMLSSFSGMIPMIVGISIIIYMVLMYLLTKIVIDKNALHISFMKVFGYEENEIRKLYLQTTTITVLVSLLLCLPLEYLAVKGCFTLALMKMSGYIAIYLPIYLYCEIVVIGIVSYFIINFFHIRRVNKIEMASSLKNSE